MRDWLREIRKRNGWSMSYVAEKAGIRQSSYCDIEHGKKNPSVVTAKKLAKIFQCEWTRFFDEVGA